MTLGEKLQAEGMSKNASKKAARKTAKESALEPISFLRRCSDPVQ